MLYWQTAWRTRLLHLLHQQTATSLGFITRSHLFKLMQHELPMAPPSFFITLFRIALVTVHAIPAPYRSPEPSEQPPTTAKLEVCPYPHPSSGVVAEPVTPKPHVHDLNTADDLINNLCAEIILIFARGTGNPGNIGTSLGYPLLEAMRDGLNQTVIAQGVLPYPAKAIGYLKGGSTEGVDSMVTLTYKARCQCQNSGLVLAGFRFVVNFIAWGNMEC